MDKVHIDLGANSYDVIIDRGLIERTGKEIKDLMGAKKSGHSHRSGPRQTLRAGLESTARSGGDGRSYDGTFSP